MRRIATVMVTGLLLVVVAGYASEVFTGEVQYEQSCPACRAVRFSGRRYGLKYERVEECALTQWYRSHVDPLHGLDRQHPHQWRQSACTVFTRRGWGVLDYDCVWVPPIFVLKPEVELAALEQIPDRETQVGLIQALDSPSRRANAERAKLLIEYHYALRDRVTWHDWWLDHAYQFGLGEPPAPKAPIVGPPKESDPFVPHSPVVAPSTVIPH